MTKPTDLLVWRERAALAHRPAELLAPIDATSVTLTRDEAVLMMGILAVLAEHLGQESGG